MPLPNMSECHSRTSLASLGISLAVMGYRKGLGQCSRMMSGWDNVVRSLQQSERLLQSTLNGNEEEVARAIDLAHDEHTSILSYNDENSLACVLSIAYYYAAGDYIIHREYATGKGFADLVLIPRKHVDSPALVIELKYNQDADTANHQIKRKEYPAKVAQYTDNLLLVGISYDRETKTHKCCIQKYQA